MLMALWIEAVVDSEAPRFEAATEVPGFVVAAEASRGERDFQEAS